MRHDSRETETESENLQLGSFLSHVFQGKAAVSVWNKFWWGSWICCKTRFGVWLVSHFKDLLVGVGVHSCAERWTGSWPVFREEPPWLVAHATCIAECFWPHWPCPPLRCLGYLTVHTFPHCLWWWTILVLTCWESHFDLLFLLVLTKGLLWCLDRGLGKILRVWGGLAGAGVVLRVLAGGRRRRDQLHHWMGIEGCRTCTLAACTSTWHGDENLRATRYSLLPRTETAAFKDWDWTCCLELGMSYVLLVGALWLLLLHGETSTRERVLNKIWQPFQLYNVFILE